MSFSSEMYIISILKSGRERCSSPRLSKYFIFSLPNYCSIKNYTYLCTRNHKGAIAQLVEQRTENPCVPGSIPGGTTLQIAECSAVGSALRSGRRGRAFESPHSDIRIDKPFKLSGLSVFFRRIIELY